MIYIKKGILSIPFFLPEKYYSRIILIICVGYYYES